MKRFVQGKNNKFQLTIYEVYTLKRCIGLVLMFPHECLDYLKLNKLESGNHNFKDISKKCCREKIFAKTLNFTDRKQTFSITQLFKYLHYLYKTYSQCLLMCNMPCFEKRQQVFQMFLEEIDQDLYQSGTKIKYVV